MNDTGDIRVSFGDHETDEMPVPWASKMLTQLKEINAPLFGALLAQAVTGVAPKRARGQAATSE